MLISSWRFKRARRYRHFALLDTQGVCVAFKSSEKKPAGEQWVEVEHMNLAWLGKPLGHRVQIERHSSRPISMSMTQRHGASTQLAILEDALRLHTRRLKKLQRFWVPLQQRAPKWVLALWVVGVCVSVVTQCYCHWLVISPLIIGLIVGEIIIDERQTTLQLRAEALREVLREAQDT